jgi:hypothetical protein
LAAAAFCAVGGLAAAGFAAFAVEEVDAEAAAGDAAGFFSAFFSGFFSVFFSAGLPAIQ